MTWVAVAIGGSALVGAIASNNAANKAASAQTNAANSANALAQGQYNQNRLDMAPWRNTGAGALNQLNTLFGIPANGGEQDTSRDNFNSAAYLAANPDVAANAKYGNNAYQHYLDFGQGEGRKAFWNTTPTATANTSDPNWGALTKNFSMADFQTDPGYAFRLAEGQKALERSGSARGMTLSGAQSKALQGYGQDMASNEYQAAYNRFNNNQMNLFNRLSGLAGTGQQATQYTGSLGSSMANQAGQNLMSAGNANAANSISNANTWNNAVNTGVNGWQNQNMWNSLLNNQNGMSGSLGHGSTYDFAGSQPSVNTTNAGWLSNNVFE